jgi:hypothetical protein
MDPVARSAHQHGPADGKRGEVCEARDQPHPVGSVIRNARIGRLVEWTAAELGDGQEAVGERFAAASGGGEADVRGPRGDRLLPHHEDPTTVESVAKLSGSTSVACWKSGSEYGSALTRTTSAPCFAEAGAAHSASTSSQRRRMEPKEAAVARRGNIAKPAVGGRPARRWVANSTPPCASPKGGSKSLDPSVKARRQPPDPGKGQPLTASEPRQAAPGEGRIPQIASSQTAGWRSSKISARVYDGGL